MMEARRGRLTGTALKLLGGDEETARDLVQETFARALALPPRTGDPRAEATWGAFLFTTLRNLCMSELRRARCQARSSSLPYVDDPAEGETGPGPRAQPGAPIAVAIAREESQAIRCGLSRLSELERALVTLVDQEQLTIAKAAGQLGIASHVAKRVRRQAHEKLVESLVEARANGGRAPGSGAIASPVGRASPRAAEPGRRAPRSPVPLAIASPEVKPTAGSPQSVA